MAARLLLRGRVGRGETAVSGGERKYTRVVGDQGGGWSLQPDSAGQRPAWNWAGHAKEPGCEGLTRWRQRGRGGWGWQRPTGGLGLRGRAERVALAKRSVKISRRRGKALGDSLQQHREARARGRGPRFR